MTEKLISNKELMLFSTATARLECLAGANRERISRATGFFVTYNEQLFLLTNDHVLSGLGKGDRRILHPNGAIPQHIRIIAQVPKQQPPKINEPTESWTVTTELPLYSDLETMLDPLWIPHPTLGSRVDVVALRLNTTSYVTTKIPMSLKFKEEPTKYRPMDRVFVVGFALEEQEAPNRYPIYKGATIATEPDYLSERPFIYIDGKTKSGMSGSPVVLKHDTKIENNGGTATISTGATELIGIYSGRDALDPTTYEAELGIMWPYKEAIKPVLDAALSAFTD